jgi:hypothetical protein
VYKLRAAHKHLAEFMAARQAYCRFLLVIDTHSDYQTGELVHGRSKNNGQSLIAPIDEVRAAHHVDD